MPSFRSPSRSVLWCNFFSMSRRGVHWHRLPSDISDIGYNWIMLIRHVATSLDVIIGHLDSQQTQLPSCQALPNLCSWLAFGAEKAPRTSCMVGVPRKASSYADGAVLIGCAEKSRPEGGPKFFDLRHKHHQLQLETAAAPTVSKSFLFTNIN